MKVNYFYGAQVERLMKHMIRLFGNFSIQDGYDKDGNPTFSRVPCRNGDISRQAAVALRENSENKAPTAPFMTVTINNMNMSRDNVRAPLMNQTVVGVNKKNNDTNQYTNQLEGYYEVERMNPVPWEFEFVVDIWTTTQQSKFELFEQIATLFAPSVPLQLGNNPLDPTSFSYVELMGYTHTSRSFPQGTDYNLDISQFTFKTMVFLSLPAKVNRAQLIQQIVTDINVPAINDLQLPTLSNWTTVATDVYAPGNHTIELKSTQNSTEYRVKLLSKHGLSAINGRILSWDKLLTYYQPDYAEKITQMRLLDQLEGDATQIVGNLTQTDVPNEMLYTLNMDSLDATTIEPVLDFVDASKTLLSDVSDGRYIMSNVEHVQLSVWTNTNSEMYLINGDIIEIKTTNGVRSVEIVLVPSGGEVLNVLATMMRYKYLKQTGWNNIIKDLYSVGFWRLSFITV